MSTLDHLVIAGADLVALVGWWNGTTGAPASRGGVHDGFGTRNALIGAGASSYVELIAPDPDQPPPEQPRPFGIDALDPSTIQFVAFALAVHDLEASVARIRSLGFDPGQPRNMSRRLTDGSDLSWRLAVPPVLGPQPFLIEWGDSESRHPASGLDPLVVIESLEIHVPEGETDRFADLFAALDHDADLHTSSAPGATARLRTPKGLVTL